MNADELRKMMEARLPSRETERLDVSALHCYGCAHSAASEPPPGKPSGERPCCACVRNPEREQWAKQNETRRQDGPMPRFVTDDRGNARIFDPFAGTQYNGVPMVHHPMDRYVTMDSRAQEDWLEQHPEYAGAVTFDAAGNVKVVEE